MSSSENIIVTCPTCNEYIVIEKLNCCIFRHGIFKDTNKQIDPHSPKNICDFYVKENQIYGCGKPFIIVFNNDEYLAKHCEYI
jgi:hypothetical protein